MVIMANRGTYVAGKALMHRFAIAWLCFPYVPTKTIGLGLKLTKSASGACESSTPARAPHHLSIPALTSDGMQNPPETSRGVYMA
jgi:hypothetical protein